MESNENLSNPQDQFLISILNTMYNDNLRHINSITATLNSLLDSNNQIRHSLVTLLNRRRDATVEYVPRANTLSGTHGPVDTRERTQFLRGIGGSTTGGGAGTGGGGQPQQRSARILVNGRAYEPLVTRTSPMNSSSSLPSTSTSVPLPPPSTAEALFAQLIDTMLRPSADHSTAFYTDLPSAFHDEDEVVAATRAQIEAATRNVRYSDISCPIATCCPITMEDFSDTEPVTMIRACRHIFKPEAIQNWFRTSPQCPVCRYDIRENSRSRRQPPSVTSSDDNI